MTRLVGFIVIILLAGCNKKNEEIRWNHLDDSNNKLTDVIISDIFTPPVASRIYAYTNIAAYEALVPFSKEHVSLVNQLNGFDENIQVDDTSTVNPSIASFVAFHETAKKMVFDEMAINDYMNHYLDSLEEMTNSTIYSNSVKYGSAVAKVILDWADKDKYNERKALSRHQLTKDPGKWIPTPPDYMEGIEPNWNTLRTFVLDSVDQFKPQGPTLFDTLEHSDFYRESYEVYTTVKNLSNEQQEIAKFWDCNPNISYRRGHVMFYEQKLSPGGHWIGITQQVIRKENLDLIESAEALALTSIALADAFISCWDEKYRSNLVRPQTYINRYIDDQWEPVLQTPAFPEYTSGHSVISTAAATTLTELFGDHYQFTDSTEVPFGLPARSFDSFISASQEAAISRLYGGIHYMPAISHGQEQGSKVGNFIMKSIRTRK